MNIYFLDVTLCHSKTTRGVSELGWNCVKWFGPLRLHTETNRYSNQTTSRIALWKPLIWHPEGFYCEAAAGSLKDCWQSTEAAWIRNNKELLSVRWRVWTGLWWVIQNSQSDLSNSWTNTWRLKQTLKAKLHFKAVHDQFSIQQGAKHVE